MTARTWLAAAVLPLVLLAGCGDDTGDTGDGGDTGDTGGDPAALDWAASADPISPAGQLVWAEDGVIHLPDGTTWDAGVDIASYVVAGDGAYVLADGSTELLHVDADGARPTGAHADPQTLRASPDGRFLVFLDPDAGTADQYDTPLLVTVVVDLERGEEVLRSSAGMGDLKTDDLADLYEDAAYGTLGITDDTAWVLGATGEVLTVALPDGDVTSKEVSNPNDPTLPWYTPRFEDDLNGGPWNADHTWVILEGRVRDRFQSADGQVVEPRPDTAMWTLGGWINPTTAVGTAVAGPVSEANLVDPDAERTLMTCTVPDGACTPVPGAGSGAFPPADSLS